MFDFKSLRISFYRIPPLLWSPGAGGGTAGGPDEWVSETHRYRENKKGGHVTNDSMISPELGKPRRVPESNQRYGIRPKRQENAGSQNQRVERTRAERSTKV